MSLSEEQIAQIEMAVQSNLKEGTPMPDGLDSIINFDHCQTLLQRSKNPYTIYYASSKLAKIMKMRVPSLEVVHMTEFADWILNYCCQHISDFANLESNLRNLHFKAIGEMLASLIFYGWNKCPVMQKFAENILNTIQPSDPINTCFVTCLFCEIILAIQSIQDPEFKIKNQIKNEELLFCFKYAIMNLEKVNDANDPIAINSMSLVLTCLTFDVRDCVSNSIIKQDDVCREQTQLVYSFKEVISNKELFQLIFKFIRAPDVSEHFIVLCLDVVYYICSIKSSFFTSKNDKICVLGSLVSNLREISNIEKYSFLISSKVFLKFTLVLYKMIIWMEVDLCMGLNDFQELACNCSKITINKLSNGAAINENQAIIYLMKFWVHLGLKYHQPTVNQIYLLYINSLISAANENPDELVEILHLNCGSICESASIIPKLLKTQFDQLAQEIINSFNSTLSDYITSINNKTQDIKIYDAKLALLIIFMTSGLRSQINTKISTDAKEYEIQFLELLLNAMKKTGELLPQIMESGYISAETSILIFFRYLKETIFENVNFPFDNYEMSVHSFIELFDKVIERLYISLRFDSENTKLAVKCLDILVEFLSKKEIQTENKQNVKAIKLLSTIEVFTNLTMHEHLPFSYQSQYKNETIAIMSVITKIVMVRRELLQIYLDGLNERLINLTKNLNYDTLLLFLYDMIGSLKSNDENCEFVFNWIFPSHLEMFTQIIDQLLSGAPYNVINTYLKFLYLLIWQNPENKSSSQKKIQIPTHSANGIILFNLISNVLKSTFKYATEIQILKEADVYEGKMKTIKYSLLIFSEIMSNDKIMFEAFQFYGNHLVVNLISSYMSLVQSIDIDYLFTLPKLSNALLQSFSAISKYHLSSVISVGSTFVDFLFDIIYKYLCNVDDKISQNAIDTSKDICSFLNQSKDNPSIMEIIDRNEFKITCFIMEIWNKLLNTNSQYFNLYKTYIAFRMFMQLNKNQQIIQIIQEQTKSQIPKTLHAQFDIYMQPLLVESSILNGYEDKEFSVIFTHLRRISLGLNISVHI